MKTSLVTALVLGLHAQSGFAQDRLECVLPQGGRIVMEGDCKALYGNDPKICDTQYATRYLGPDGAAPVELGITSMRRTGDSGTPAQMCANFYVRDGAVHAGGAEYGQYRTVAKGQLASLEAKPRYDKEVEKQANRESARRALSRPGYTRMAVQGTTWVVEDALTRWHWGHYADADFYRQPLSHVSQTLSTDQGKSWSAPVITSASRLFAIGTSAQDQPDAAKPGASTIAAKRQDRRALLAQGKQLVLRCRLPDQSEFVLSGMLQDDEDANRQSGGEMQPFVPLASVSYVAAPGRAAISVDPDLALLMGLPTAAAGPAQDQVCNGAGLANGLPFIGITMLDQDGKRFTRFDYPDKIWFPGDPPRQIREMLMRQELTYGINVAVSRRGKLIGLEYPLVSQTCASGARGDQAPVCPVGGVLRSESHDNGVSWSDLAFSKASWIFTQGKALEQQPGRATLQRR
ncbi:hypothetical protein CR152_14960 [Massilia violaceinigra]|uniref:Uncharacterized protein n=1 Tax=Massilia violaceinigra TaxID=2045208 RepID=A0A2D2DL33_9BURK|nr:hypothetical protein [Massilia violaceinigra]ATQ75683.1 hypothetical protein CR152_14960 [Massilia violaceinigra]